ncbi:MAG: RsbRD N-terminal domain-containing protein [bacterium]
MLVDLLTERRQQLLEQWRQAIRETYPSETAHFLKERHDQFHNPVGHIISEQTEILLDQLLGPMDDDTITSALTEIVQIRAIQDFCPADAVAFVALLKPIVREVCFEEGFERSRHRELIKFEDRIDSVQGAAFNIYSECRDRLADIRVNEEKRRHQILLEKLNARVRGLDGENSKQ